MFVVFVTIVFVCIMYSQSPFKGNVLEDKQLSINQNDSNRNEKVSESKGKKTDNKSLETKDNKYETNNKNNKVEKPNSDQSGIGSKKASVEKVNNNSEQSKFKAAESEKASYPTSAAVFKIEPEKLQGELTLLDKRTLLAVITKISPVDYAKINNYLKDENHTRGVINIFSLLKTRLSKSDYKQFKDMASKYVDVDCIESYIN